MKKQTILNWGNLLSYLIFWIFQVASVITTVSFAIQLSNLQYRNEDNLELLRIAVIALGVAFVAPLATILVALKTKILKQPHKLLQLLFGVELPIIAFANLSILYREINLFSILVFLTLVLSTSSYLFYVFIKIPKNTLLHMLLLLCHQFAVVMGFFSTMNFFMLGAIIIFLPLLALSVIFDQKAFFGEAFLQDSMLRLPVGTVIIFSYFYFMLYMAASPFVGLVFYWRSARNVSLALRPKTNPIFPWLLRWTVAALYLIMLLVLMAVYKPFGDVFSDRI